jgi:hypothetical protein
MSSGWGNDPDAPGSGTPKPEDQTSTQPAYQPPMQASYGDPQQPGQGQAAGSQQQPTYGGPTQPTYGGPGQPGYQGPSQPGYPPPTPSSYPGQPDYQAPAPPPGYGAPPPPPPGYGGPMQPGGYVAVPQNKRPSWLGAAVVGVIVVLVVGGFFLFRDRLSNDVTSLDVGQCFDTPRDTTQEVSDVQRQPCNEPHDAEVIASLTHPAPAGEPYPVVSGFQDYIQDNCVPAFNTYTGRDFDTDPELDMSFFRPTMSGWNDGDRGFTCFVTRIDHAKMNSSVRVGARSSP